MADDLSKSSTSQIDQTQLSTLQGQTKDPKAQGEQSKDPKGSENEQMQQAYNNLMVLKEQRQRIFAAAQKILDRFNKEMKQKNVHLFESQMERLTKLQSDFDTCSEKINEMNSCVPEKYRLGVIKQGDSFDDIVHTAQVIFWNFKKLAETPPQTTNPSFNNGISSQVRLPVLELPRFSGELKEWTRFYNLFESSINKNENLTPVAKFEYLLTRLDLEPLQSISTLEITSENYAVAWDLLCKRYNSDRRHVAHHLNGLLDLPELSTSSVLPKFLAKLNEHTHALTALKQDANSYNLLLTAVLLRKFSNYYLGRFEDSRIDRSKYPTFKEIEDFLNAESAKLDSMRSSKVDSQKSNFSPKSQTYSKPAKVFHAKVTEKVNKSPHSSQTKTKGQTRDREMKCPWCSEAHSIFKCDKIKRMPIEERRNQIQRRNKCSNCFADSHELDACKSRFRCFKCKEKHHTLLCDENAEKTKAISLAAQSQPIAATNQYHSSILGTALVEIADSTGNYQQIRVVIDSGSMASFITEECAKRLQLPVNSEIQKVTGLGDKEVESKGSTEFWIKPRQKAEPKLRVKAIIIPTITENLPCTPIPDEVKQEWSNLDLADPQFYVTNKIDVLLGIDIFPYIYTGQKRLSENLGNALLSIFGWVIVGRIQAINYPSTQTSLLTTEHQKLRETLQKFWQIEEAAPKLISNPDDDIAEKQFRDLHYRLPDGRYVVPILLKNDAPAISDSYTMAEKRLKLLQKRLEKMPKIKEDYAQFLKEYETLGHMIEVKELGQAKNYIPHMFIIRDSSLTTKLRVVFDASMMTIYGGISLNQVLYVGPKTQNDITEILLRFRTHKVALTTDVTKMFRQILIRPQDRAYQHILWEEDPTKPIKEYELCTVTYGTTSAPFLSGRVIKQLTLDEKHDFPEAAEALSKDVFVDDVITGTDDVESAIELKNQLIGIAGRGQFELQKWSCNYSEVLKDLNPTDIALSPEIKFDGDDSNSLGVLGLRWSPSNDTFSYSEVEFSHKLTKRSILADTARVFDPVGWITPVILPAKILIQRLWIAGLDWDDSVPPDLAQVWLSILNQLPLLAKLKIPRLIFNPNEKQVILIGFSDGSQVGYGATVYIRAPSKTGYATNLLIAKSKVAPTKPLTIPRLELCGAELLVKIIQVARTSLNKTNFIIERVVALSDSSTVLSWLTTPPYMLKTYVANRVANITETMPAEYWAHVSTKDNPADLASRGTSPKNLVNNNFWWNGPDWLQKPISDWKIASIQSIQNKKEIPELKAELPKIALNTTVSNTHAQNFSSWQKLRRITAWCLRFYENVKRSKKGEKKVFDPLTTHELNNAQNRLIIATQQAELSDELKHLNKNNKKLSPHMLSLNPFYDSEGVLRVGGRLSHSQLNYSAKHPAILPKKSHLTNLIIEHYHKLYLHAGPRNLQSILSQNFWIISARNAIRSHLLKCVRCYRNKPKPSYPKMGELPKSRVTVTKCFLKVGTDYGGPILIKESKRRNSKFQKAYICLFVCMATKAIHLELVSDLSTEAFLASIDRFISRRGLCSDIYSDCGSNFQGANNHFNELQNYLKAEKVHAKIHNELADRNIKWHFNPPSAPHFGGIWEAGIKATKYHLKRTIGEHKFTFEEVSTLLTKIEAILNSRPLCVLTSDTDELNALTPAHFIVGGPLLSLPEYDWSATPENRLSRWQMIQKITQHFWQRWSAEYLNTLNQRLKWQTQSDQLKINDVVMIRDDNAPPLSWRLARVTEVHLGDDQIARVATLRCASGQLLKRPVTKLCRLPLN